LGTRRFARPRITRRRFLLGVAATGLGLGAYAWRVEPHRVSVVRRDMPVRGLSAALEGRTLAQVSDLHVGHQVDPDYLASALRRLSALQPDIVVVTGDFMSCDAAERVDDVARVMENLAPAPLGRFAVPGNHDYGHGWSNREAVERLAGRLGGLGIRLLRNESADAGGLRVAGLDDLWGPNFRPDAVLPRLGPDEPAVVLCHNPDAADWPVWGAYRGWILSGHTHGGQCKPPFLPPPLLPVSNRRYTAGEFDLGDGRTLYINRGLGHLLRARFNVRPEITLFRLVAA
jgi:predicted MPP superfamily phosphohydrolase